MIDDTTVLLFRHQKMDQNSVPGTRLFIIVAYLVLNTTRRERVPPDSSRTWHGMAAAVLASVEAC